MKQINTLYIGCISWESVKNLNTTAQRFERNQTQKEHKKHKKYKNSNRVGCPKTSLSKATWHPILYLPVFLISFLFKCISFRPSVHQRCNSLPTTVSSPLSSQTTTVGSTRAQSSSSTQQPGDRRTALLSPTVGLLLSLRLICHTAPTAVLPPWQQTCSTCPASGRSCSVLNHPYLVLPGDAQCSHSSHSSAPTAPTAVLPQLPQLPQLP